MKRNTSGPLLVAAASVFLITGCGSGGGGSPSGSSNVSVPPISSPAPTPAPNATPTPGVFGALGQTASQAFAVLTISYRGADNGFDLTPDPISISTTNAVGLRFSAPSDLLLSVDGFGEGKMSPNGSGGSSSTLGTFLLGYSVLAGVANLSAAFSPGGASTLKSTATGSWERLTGTDPKFPYLATAFVYGVPTRFSDLPQLGSGVYEYSEVGKRKLTFDFAARTVTGALVLGDTGSTVTYRLRDGTLSSDGTFRAALITDGVPKEGLLEGRLTGLSGAELMARHVTPQSSGLIGFDVWGATRI